jgi:hypothetical protein
MSNKRFYIIVVAIVALCNVTILAKGYSYIGYACVISLLMHVIFTMKNPLTKPQYCIVMAGFVLSLLNIATEISDKFYNVSELDPTKYNLMFFVSLIYLIIAILIAKHYGKKGHDKI